MFFKKKLSEETVHQEITSICLFKDHYIERSWVKKVEIQDDKVKIELSVPQPVLEMSEQIKESIKERLKQKNLALLVWVNITSQKTPQGQTIPSHKLTLPNIKNMIAVASGKGGVGKSTVTVNLAVALAKMGKKVALLDADIYGPSIPLMFGISDFKIETKDKFILPLEKYGIKLMSMGFLAPSTKPVIWRGPMVSGALTQFLTQVQWGELDYLLIDMPPGTGDAQLTLSQNAPLTGAIIVTTPQDVSLIDAEKGLLMFESVKVPVLGIIENMSGFVCDHCRKETFIFKKGGGEKIANKMNAELLGHIPIEPSISEGGDIGKPALELESASIVSEAFLKIAKRIDEKLKTPAFNFDIKPISLGAKPSGKFRILWSDGKEVLLDPHHIRVQCKCANCVDEWTREKILDQTKVPKNIQILKAEPIGNYALSFTFSDGHSTGIYTFEHLRELA